MIYDAHLREKVIQPVLTHLGLYSLSAENLLVLTAAVESKSGRYLIQLGNGPARGIYQMEGATHDDIWRNFLRYKGAESFDSIAEYLSRVDLAPDTLAERVRSWQIPGLHDEENADEMVGNLFYATAMARIHYLRRPEPLPADDDYEGLAQYWKKHYNTHLGAGTVEKALAAYRSIK